MKWVKTSDRLPVGRVDAILDDKEGTLVVYPECAVFSFKGTHILLAYHDDRLYDIVWKEKSKLDIMAEVLHNLADICDSRMSQKDKELAYRSAYFEYGNEFRKRAIKIQENGK